MNGETQVSQTTPVQVAPDNSTKKTWYVVVLATLLLVGFVFFYFSSDVCSRVTTYELGRLDEEFGLSRDEALRALFDAENVWDSGTFLNLFEYRKDPDITVNFIFDERQQETVALAQAEKDLAFSEEIIENNQARYDALKTDIDVAKAQYQQSERAYQNRLNVYNLKVQSINSQGGATGAELRELEQEERELAAIRETLVAKSESINNKITQLNLLVGQTESVVDRFNAGAEDFNSRFSGEKIFDQGEYVSNGEINIYQYDGFDDLVLVLAHEFGHALGIDHVADPRAIMYYLLDEQDLGNVSLTDSDKDALRGVCSGVVF